MLLVEKMLKVALFLTISCWDPHNRTGLGTVRTDKSPSDLRDGREGLRHTLQGYPQGGITGVFGAMVGPYATKEATKESSRNHESHVLNLT